MAEKNLTSLIDHTNLQAAATAADIGRLCEEACRCRFAAVCVNPCRADQAARALAGSGVKVAVVIGFPLGATTTATKAFEAAEAVANGADELDLVINIGALREGNDSLVEEDIAAVVRAVGKAPVKAIIETCYLTEEQIIRACRLAVRAGAAFVKTSTGFGSAGAIAEHVRLMRRTVGPKIGVKAAGGIHGYDEVLAMVEAGADRIGTSSGVKIMEGQK